VAYTKQTWADNDASKPLSAARMNHIEVGVEAAAAAADAAGGTNVAGSVTNGALVWNGSAWANALITNSNIDAAAAIAKTKLAALNIADADVASAAAIAESKLSLASDAAAGTASRRTLGTGATQAMAGNDPRVATGQLATFTSTGAQTVKTGTARFRFPAAATIIGVSMAINTAPTGASLIADVNKNGTTIFTTQANRPSIAISANATASPAVPDVTAYAAGDYVTIDVDQVGSTIAGSDLTVHVRYAWA
jgi:hypothetical protein